MGFSTGDVVLSTAGRDRGRLFFVLEAGGGFVTLADGKVRKLERPKRKNEKHVRKVSQSDTLVAGKLRAGQKVLNSELRKDLAILGQASPDQGGE